MRRVLLGGLGRVLLTVLIALGALAGFVRLSSGLVGELAASRAWIKQPDFTETSKSNEDLFKQAVKAGLIWLEPEGPSVRIQPCEALFDPGLASPSPAAGQPFPRGLLDRICNLPAGRQILSEIQAWNTSFLVAAVRDDRAVNQRCADGTVNDLPVTPAGCRPAAWTARVAQTSDVIAPLNVMPGASPPPRDFSEFAARRARNLSDWALFGPLRGDADRLALTTLLPAGARRVTADLIFEPSHIVVGSARAAIDPRRESQTVRAGGLSIAAERVCSEEGDVGSCVEAKALGLPHGWRLSFSGGRGKAGVQVTVEGAPIRAVPPAMREVMTGAREGRLNLWRSANIEADCERKGKALACALDWRGAVTQRRTGGARQLAFADGSPAIDATGRPTALVDELGLTALVGYGPDDVGSLASAVGRARTREPLVLTIDPTLQRLAQDAVLGVMGERIGRGARPRKPGAINENPTSPEPPDQGDGRAMVVLMDAGDAPGEVLGIAAWPAFQPGMHSWDILALSSGRDADSPLAGHGWRAGDVHTMPGSTFKLVTGLAGVAATRERPSLADAVSGRASPAAQAQMFGVTGGVLSVDGLPIQNYGGAGFNAAVLQPSATGCPANGRGGQISVCEALMKSSNLWFAGLALTFDGAKVAGRPTGEPGRTGTLLAKETERLFPISQAGAAVQPGVDLTRGLVPGAQRLLAEPIDLAVEDKRNARRIDLATNSYGQGVRATPLAMATIYGSVGARAVLSPRVLKPVTDVAKPDLPHAGGPLVTGFDKAGEAPWLDIVAAGLHAVVNAPGGTASGVMGVLPPEVRTRIYGKTGTADTAAGMNSAWFAGWIDGAAGRKRIAFACLVTHTRLTGGRACGALMAPLLGRIAALDGKS